MSSSAPPSFSGRQNYVLRGSFSEQEKTEIITRLEQNGFTQKFSMRSADFILIPQHPASDQIQTQAKKFALSILSVQEMNELQNLSTHLELDSSLLPPSQTQPAFEITEQGLRILDLTLPLSSTYSSSSVPSSIQFQHLCLDRTFLVNARQIAFAAKFDIPCTLEGETSTSKTTVIQWLAHLLKKPIYRLNLNGQTDTSELIGRYVPTTGYQDLNLKHLLKSIDQLDHLADSPQWKALYEKVKFLQNQSESSPPSFSPLESLQIAQMLGLPQKSWEFMEGIIPKALRDGGWVILDEMNLAEPQILERLNSLLEDEHTLVLTEGDGRTFGVNGDLAVHPEFRIFGTMNPAEYAGRSALSPAFRDRWRLWKFVDSPTENQLYEMLYFLVFGEQPIFDYKGTYYQAPSSPPLYPALQTFPQIKEYLRRLSTFHYQLTLATGQGGSATIGRTRRERYIFTRRSLLTCMRLWDALWSEYQSHSSSNESQMQEHATALLEELLEQIYLDRIQHESDQTTLRTTMRSAGLVQK